MGLVSYFRAKSESLVLIAVILIAHREFRSLTTFDNNLAIETLSTSDDVSQ